MTKKIILKAPVLTRSGYGEQSRFALRALRSRPELFDVYIQPLQWGQTSWIGDEVEDRQWIDHTIEKTIAYIQQGGHFDASLQVTIPNEWESMATVDIGYTAGMETTKVAPEWIEKGNQVDKIIVVSNHSRDVYKNTEFVATHQQTQEQKIIKLTTPIETVNYPVKEYEDLPELDLELTPDFNFLVIAQAGPRKNLPNTIKWFVEEFHNEEVGLVIKANIAKNCLMDRAKLHNDLKGFIAQYPDRKCKIYLLHGDMTDEEIHALIKHPKIQGFFSLTHGEGFGLPLFEAAYSGVPVIVPGWSGQLDFLVNKETGLSEFYNVEYDIAPIPEPVVWEGVIIKESMWAYAREHSAKQQLRQCYAALTGDKREETMAKVEAHAEYLKEKFSTEKQYSEMVAHICDAIGIDTEVMQPEVMEID